MQLYDKDLLSVQEVRTLLEKAKTAQQELASASQETIDNIIAHIAKAGVRNAKRLAKMANEDTEFGIVDDKVIKNIFASKGVYDYIKDMKTVGEIGRDPAKKTRDIAVPVGVIAGLVPSTNPTSTVLYKAEIAIKAGNAIVFSPHPNALRCILETVKVIRQAIAEAGANEDLVSCITIPTMQATSNLMQHPDVSMILATGGAAMVRAAYSSGTPAIGVGPGNGPAYLDRTTDLKKAVKQIMDSETFDNGTICASEQSIICDDDMAEAVQKEMESQGAYFLNEEESKKLGKFILRANGTMNPMIVGRSAQKIAELAELSIPQNVRVLVAKEDGVGLGHPYSNEKLCPILAFYTGKDYKEVCQKVTEILHYEGAGHTFSIHTENDKLVDYFAARVPASRIIVNCPSSLGGIGAATGLMPSLTLGCGAVGGSATSDNVGPMNLLNIRRVAYGLKEADDIRKEAEEVTGECFEKPAVGTSVNLDGNLVDDIVNAVIRQIQGNVR
ncbi:acetaldehyde dehydrogenase (acetylating) [Pseudoramibacter sp.]|jgi:acetaldehyde dehydrogenase (acetylating)|uniref:acetaldehyde dehydrogenase (acetylating) n=1 Tax=Pseudoramibacter sp. TaxID=2034862 RepID=UPI0025E3F8A4|nr:acetaldehyde dehydrogenase (acetylating) [Pseudoramibacter sp.]MCH4071392.1 acetaldehyde dehydrogenase (acetylating) [Pseudoramibacter sp.]MCH4105160.1 acetaldehyde dehydrogenase (acetylating) [Pseudoramibacter sp.]